MLSFGWEQSQHYELSDCPHPTPQAALPPLPLSVWQYNLQPFERILKTVICLNYHTYVKKQEKACMVEEPLHVKQLSLNHMHKKGVKVLRVPDCQSRP
jgi:hypothetical protein